MSAYIIFSLIFFSQVLLLSWYLPRRIMARLRYVLDNYPASEYPKLYQSDQANAERSYNYLVWFSRTMFVIGMGILVWINLRGELIDGGIAAAIAFVYGMLQSAPIIIMDFATLRHYKSLREEDERPKRSAELIPRSIFIHTTPMRLSVVALFYIVAVTFDMYTKGFDTGLGGELYEALIILFLANLFFAGMVYWRVYGKKLNPYLDAKDNKREIDVMVSSAIFTSIAVSIFFIAMRAINVYDLEHFEGVLMSLYLQAIMGYTMLYSVSLFDVKTMNFEPFRETAD